MDETVNAPEFDLENFLRPKCQLKVGDRFHKRYHIQSKQNPIVVEKIEPRSDDSGFYYLITGRAINTAIGINVRVYDSRSITPENYIIERKGVDF